MSTATEIVDRTTEGLSAPFSTNGAAPAAPRGPNPVVLLALAFALGIALARLIAWRVDAHPRR